MNVGLNIRRKTEEDQHNEKLLSRDEDYDKFEVEEVQEKDMVKYKNDYGRLLESKGFTLNDYPEDGKFWELVVKDDEDLKRHICKVFKADVELLDSNMVDIDKVILQCAEDYSRCVFCYDCNPYNMETEEFMNCVENM